MNTSEKLLRAFVFVALGIIVFYSLRCIIPRIKLKENMTIQYCKPIFTAKGTEATIKPLQMSKYLNIDRNSSKDNVVLGSMPNSKWEFERIIDKKSLKGGKNHKDFYHDYSEPSRCSVFIKTKSIYKTDKTQDPNYLYYYLTRNNKEDFVPGVGNSYVSASLFGRGAGQVWYVIDVSELPVDGAYGDTVSLGKALGNDDSRFVFIVTNPIAFKNNKEDAKTLFLTANIEEKKDQYSFGSATLTTVPTENSIWEVNFQKKGDIQPLPDYKPTLAVDEYPNKDNKDFATFMNTYLPIWNRTWYSSDGNNGLKSFTIKLCSPDYKLSDTGEYSVKNTFATGSVTFDNKYTGSLNKAAYNVKSQGSNMLYGVNPKDKSTLIIKMIPQSNVPLNGSTLPRGVPTLKAWLEKAGGEVEIVSLCASDNKNFAAKCVGTNKPDSYQQYLIKKDLLPIDSNNNFNIEEEFEDWENVVNYKCSKCPSVGNLHNCIR